MGHRPKLGSYGKNWIFGPKTEILGPKKEAHFCTLTMFWPRPGKVVQRKEYPFPKQISISLQILGVFLGKKPFLTKKTLFRTESIVILGHCFDGPDGSTRFR